MRGMAKLMQVIDKVRNRLNPTLSIQGILITQFDSRKNLNRNVDDVIRESFKEKVFNTHIRSNVSLAEAPTFGTDIFLYAPRSAGAADYSKLAEEITL